MNVRFSSRLLVVIAGSILLNSALIAQSTTQLFGPINVRSSPAGTSFDVPYTFGSTTVSLTCPAGSTASLKGLGSAGNPNMNLLVDNNIIVTVTQGNIANAPNNICPVNNTTLSGYGLYNNHCFDVSWESGSSSNSGVNPDTIASTYGIAPFDFTPALQNASFNNAKPISVTFNLQDEGIVLASSTVILSTTCTINGVTGPASVGGNPIDTTQNQGSSQDFTFDTANDKLVGFGYDLTAALPHIVNNATGATPQVADLPMDKTKFQPIYAQGTSFATSNCLIHNGEVLADGVTPACKLYTLECLSPDGSTLKGANCPVSSQVNEVVEDKFDGPPFSLPNIVTPFGSFREGMGFIMASEGWPGGNCSFDASSGLSALACPQNLLTSFTGPGAFSGTGLTTNPNSTFLSIYGVPEDYTVAALIGGWPNSWVNTRTPGVKFLTLAPNFTLGAWTQNGNKLVSLPGASKYVPAPIKSLTYGVSPANALPNPIDEPILGDNTLPTSADCSLAPYTTKSLPPFNPPVQQLSFSSDGHFLLHYFAQDCAGTQELAFTQDQSGSWMTNFYTIPVNVDTIKPSVVGLTLPAPATIKKGVTLYATYRCTDDPSGSGVVLCGTSVYGTETTYNTGTLKTKLDTSSKGPKFVTIIAKDGAGNQVSTTVGYTVN